MKGDVKAEVSGEIKMWLKLSVPYDATDLGEDFTEEDAFNLAWDRATELIVSLPCVSDKVEFLSDDLLPHHYKFGKLKIIEITVNVSQLDVNLVNRGGKR